MAGLSRAAMSRVARGSAAQYTKSFVELYGHVVSSGAATGELVLGFDDDTVDEGEYVPELVLRVKIVGATD